MNFSDYVVEKAVAERKQTNDEFHRIEAQLALAYDLALYGLLHILYVGWNPPMPVCQPEDLKGTFGQQTFLEFLQAHDLTAMGAACSMVTKCKGTANSTKSQLLRPAVDNASHHLGDPWRSAWVGEYPNRDGLDKGVGRSVDANGRAAKPTITYDAQTRSIVRS